MRELYRSIAKANMRDAGFEKLFKPGIKEGEGKRRSLFARNWKDWVVPEGKNMKMLARARFRKAKATA